MRRHHTVTMLATIIIWSTASTSSAESPLPLRVTVRVYAPPSSALADALSQAAATLKGAGVEPVWLSCDATGPGSACARPIDPGELALRFSMLSVPASYAGRLPLGDSLIDPRRHAGVLATIYPERVRWLARAAGTDATVLLGRAIAHEIAHLLIGSARHASKGLMRAVWTCEEIERGRPRDWTFTAADAAAMRRHAAGSIAWSIGEMAINQ